MSNCNFVSSLQYGKIPSKGEYTLLWVFVYLLFLIPLTTICIAITISCGVMSWEKEIIIALILVNVMFCIFIIITVYMLKYYRKLYKNIEEWIKDSVVTTATVKRMDLVSSSYKPYQVEFNFEIDGQNFKRLSSSGGVIVGLNKQLVKYHNKTVKILYSPKYDQVILLKE